MINAKKYVRSLVWKENDKYRGEMDDKPLDLGFFLASPT